MRKAIAVATLYVAAVCYVAACFSTPLFAQDPSKKPTEDLVKAAQESKSKRKKSSTKVITNKDVKQAKGKLIVLDKPDTTTKTEKIDNVSSLQKHDATLRERRDAKDRLESAQKKVDGLQKELDAVEQSYYQENDPNYRDNVIQKRFAQTKRQLDDAREDLANARDAMQRLDQPPPPQSKK